jgi:hypothetical protein
MKVTFYSFHFVFFTVILHFLFTRYSYYFLSIKTAAYKDKLPRCLHASSFSRMNTSENNMEAWVSSIAITDPTVLALIKH